MGTRARADNRYYTLDCWRGVACLLIVVFHSSFDVLLNSDVHLSHGMARVFRYITLMQAGVPIFFVISGYCIAAACDNLREGQFAVRRYFLRRFRRIFPPYWVALGLTVLLALLLIAAHHAKVFLEPVATVDPRGLPAGWWVGNLTLTGTWGDTLFGHRKWYEGLFLAQAWTLCYEEQFYAVCGLAMLISRRLFFMTLAVITLVVAVLAVLHRGDSAEPSGFFFDGRWLTFAAGVAVYYRLQYPRAFLNRLIELALLALFVAGVLSYRAAPTDMHEEFRVGGAFSLLLLVLYQWDPWTRRRSRWLAACGTMCYSLYLVHLPIVRILSRTLYHHGVAGAWPTLMVTIPSCVAASLVAGFLFYMGVERHCLNPPSRRQSLAVTPVAGELAT